MSAVKRNFVTAVKDARSTGDENGDTEVQARKTGVAAVDIDKQKIDVIKETADEEADKIQKQATPRQRSFQKKKGPLSSPVAEPLIQRNNGQGNESLAVSFVSVEIGGVPPRCENNSKSQVHRSAAPSIGAISSVAGETKPFAMSKSKYNYVKKANRRTTENGQGATMARKDTDNTDIEEGGKENRRTINDTPEKIVAQKEEDIMMELFENSASHTVDCLIYIKWCVVDTMFVHGAIKRLI